MIYYVNLLFIVLYGLAYLAHYFWGINLPINVIGVIYLLFIVPFNVISALRFKFNSVLEKFLAGLVIFFFLGVPGYFFLSYLYLLRLKDVWIFLVAVLSFVFLVFRSSDKRFWKYKIDSERTKRQVRNLFKKHKLLMLFFFLYLIIHFVQFSFYKYVPGVDSYSEMTLIQASVEEEHVSEVYRGFFTTSMSIISEFTKLEPYDVFAYLMVGMQFVPVVAIYLIMRNHGLTRLQNFIVMASALSLPMINIEIDVFRAQSIFSIFLPVYFLLFYRALKTQKYYYWVLSSLIAGAGIVYHEFFLFILINHCLVGGILLFKNLFLKAKSNKDRLFFGAIVLLAGSLIVNVYNQIQSFNILTPVINNLGENIFKFEKWRLWFIDGYYSDSVNYSSYEGLWGFVKYYGYYAGPAVCFILLLIFILLIFYRKQVFDFIRKDKLSWIVMPFVVETLFVSEILPRMNYVYLPERMWLITDIALLVFSVSLIGFLFKRFREVKLALRSVYLFFIASGIIISMYMASIITPFTNEKEIEAAEWIDDNLPSNALFITQADNTPMVNYYARRGLWVPEENYFLSNKVESIESIIDNIEGRMKDKENLLKNQVDDILEYEDPEEDLDYYLTSILVEREKHNNLWKTQKYLKEDSLYILYSEQKFSYVWADEEEWQKSNFYGAELDKFDDEYNLVYEKDGIFVWEILER